MGLLSELWFAGFIVVVLVSMFEASWILGFRVCVVGVVLCLL